MRLPGSTDRGVLGSGAHGAGQENEGEHFAFLDILVRRLPRPETLIAANESISDIDGRRRLAMMRRFTAVRTIGHRRLIWAASRLPGRRLAISSSGVAHRAIDGEHAPY